MEFTPEAWSPLIFEDDATGLFNRHLLRHILRSLAPRTPALVLLDLDDLARANESLGRAAGHEALMQFAERLRGACRPGDIPGRFGQGSFFLLLPETPEEEAAAVAERIRRVLLEQPLRTAVDRAKMNLTVSAGVAGLPHDGAPPDTLIDAAVRALRLSKRGGKNRTSAAQADWKTPATLPCPVFMGRRTELELVDTLARSLRQGAPCGLLVQGDPGIGKSRFLRECADRATRAGVPCFHLTCIPTKRRVAARPLRCILELSSRPPTDGTPSSIGDALEAMAKAHPFAILLDDAGDADPATVDILRTLVVERRAPIGVISTHDGAPTQWIPSEHAVTLPPLAPEEIAGMIEAILPGQPMAPETLRAVIETAQGRPLFIEEAIRAVVLDGAALPSFESVLQRARDDRATSFHAGFIPAAPEPAATSPIDSCAKLWQPVIAMLDELFLRPVAPPAQTPPLEDPLSPQQSKRIDGRAQACLDAPMEVFMAKMTGRELRPMLEMLVFGGFKDIAMGLIARLGSCLTEENSAWRRQALEALIASLTSQNSEVQELLLVNVREPLQAALRAEADLQVLAVLEQAICAWLEAVLRADRLPMAADFLWNGVRPKLQLFDTPRTFRLGLLAKLRATTERSRSTSLVQVLKDGPPPLRQAAMRMIAVLGDPFIEPLVKLIMTTEHGEASRAAAAVLKDIGEKGPQELGRVILSNASPEAVCRVLEVLDLAGSGGLFSPVTAAAAHSDPSVQQAAFELVKRLDRPLAITILRKALTIPTPGARVLAVATAKQLKLPELGADLLRLAPSIVDDDEMRALCNFFGDFPSRDAVPVLRQVFERKGKVFGIVKGFSDEARAAALAAVYKINDPSIKELLTRAKEDKSDAVRRMATRLAEKTT
ncbi:MAG: diguanylate cyclase [Planctomycetes bacterium]|nr:diguanylate cyclase [Planctomycetota bacterium]